MAKSKLAIVRRAPSVPKAKYEGLVKVRAAAAKRAKETAARRAGTLVGIAACAGAGYLEKQGKMPSMFGIEPTAVLGVGLGFLLPEMVKGKVGQMAAEAGAALMGVAAYKLGSGQPLKVGYDEE